MQKKPSTEVAFTPYEISFCLHDTERTRLWKEAIEQSVTPGDVVIDAGSGTGILGLFAAMAGAKKVYCIELHPRFVKLITHLAKRNGMEDIIEVIHGDATKVHIEEKADLLICELLCTGQFFEPQVQVVNHLRQFLKDKRTIIPKRIQSYVRLLDAQEMLYGVRIDVDSRSVVFDDDEPVSSRVMYDEIEMDTQNKLEINTQVEVTARHNRIADAILIEAKAELCEGIWTHPTKFLFNPEVIFLQHEIELQKNENYLLDIQYPYGSDTLDAKFNVTKK